MQHDEDSAFNHSPINRVWHECLLVCMIHDSKVNETMASFWFMFNIFNIYIYMYTYTCIYIYVQIIYIYYIYIHSPEQATLGPHHPSEKDKWIIHPTSVNKKYQPQRLNDPYTSIWSMYALCSNPFCKWFWSGFWIPKRLLTGYLEH